MFTYKKLAVLVLALFLGVPSVSMAGSFVVSLVQGKTPAEAVQIIAEQIDLLTGRVASLEDKQAQLEADVSQNKSDTELEIERLNAENENLRLKADEALTGTAQTRTNEARKAQCTELGAKLGTREDAVRAPFEAKTAPLEEQLRKFRTDMHTINADGNKALAYPKPQTDAETRALLNRLESGEEMGDLTQEERDKVYAYQTLERNAIAAWVKENKTQQDKLEKQINSIDLEMEKALEALRATAEVKALQTQLDSLLCA